MKVGTLWDLVGDTPLIHIKSLSEKTGCKIFAKGEFLNPGGSIKDRAAKSIIQQAELSGQLKPAGTIVEGTAGNTGIGLATLGISRGYKVVIFMPNNQSSEKSLLLRALGAEVIEVPPCPFANENHFYHQARKYSEVHPNSFWANQFENLANFEAHYRGTGPEIWEQTEGKIDVFLSSVGTGGTLGGITSFLKEKKPSITNVLVDPHGSGLFSHFKNGEMKSTGSSITEGIGIMRITANYSKAKIDDAEQVPDSEMLEVLWDLAKHEGLLVGLSAALNLAK